MNTKIFENLRGVVIFCVLLIMFIMNLPNLEKSIRTAVNSDNEYEEMKTNFTNDIVFHSDFIDLNGWMTKVLGVKSMYSSQYINVADNGYILGWYLENSAEYEIAEINDFYNFLTDNNINLLYVNKPIKYMDDKYTLEQFGKISYGNANMDKLLTGISEAGVNILDMRERISEENLDVFELFYKTDHHWTVPAGLMCAKEIAVELNDKFGYDICMDIYADENFEYMHYEDSWLGEQGRKVAVSYVGLDDFTEVKPLQETNFTVMKNNEIVSQGAFVDVMVDETVYAPFRDGNYDVYSGDTWHYSYAPFGISGAKIINDDVETGKILYLGDSYDHVVLPFLALGVHEVDAYILRNMEGSIRDIIEAEEYDTVIIAYAGSMIGNHTVETNANYRMFDLR